jgi:hypothetical protein
MLMDPLARQRVSGISYSTPAFHGHSTIKYDLRWKPVHRTSEFQELKADYVWPGPRRDDQYYQHLYHPVAIIGGRYEPGRFCQTVISVDVDVVVVSSPCQDNSKRREAAYTHAGMRKHSRWSRTRCSREQSSYTVTVAVQPRQAA